MRFLHLIAILLFISACSHGQAPSETSGQEQTASCNCAEHDKDHEHHDCSSCAAHGACKECNHDKKERHCCGESCAEKKDDKAMCTAGSELSNNPRILKNISPEAFAQAYEKNKETLGKKCSIPATKYCGKTTKDLMVTEAEVSCLWKKVFRVTREQLPELDNTPCAKLIKKMAK
ncbi:MAG: hypothetical protein H6623_01275 [Bdellovibrionaceae bacterium]|nr:hypothetical protein [Pseudobdellovibrionaceae bacterium]